MGDAKRCWADTIDMSAHNPDSPPPFVLVTSDELRDAAIGLRIFDCFSLQGPTLTAQQVSEMLDEPQDIVTRHAERLTRIGYLRADSCSEPGAWTVTRHAW
jgi:hypothetical protein